MKRLFFIISLSIYFLIKTFAQDTIRVLAIGNSFSQDAIESYLYDLGKEDNVVFVIGNLYIGGCSLERHWKNAQTNEKAYEFRKIENGQKTNISSSLRQGIKNEKWDYISFQQNSGNSGLKDSYFPYLSKLLRYVKKNTTNPSVKFVFHQTWAYESGSNHPDFVKYNNNQGEMFNAIINATNKATAKVGIDIVVPSGTAIQNIRNSFVGDSLCRDGYHLNSLGRYTASCAWYEMLTRKSTVGNRFIPENLSALQVIVAQKAAHAAILIPNRITKIEN